MITDEYLPQPFRFLNQIVRQVVEDSIEQAVVRELSLTKIKRLRLPRDIVHLPLHVDRNLVADANGNNNTANGLLLNSEDDVFEDNNNNNNGMPNSSADDVFGEAENNNNAKTKDNTNSKKPSSPLLDGTVSTTNKDKERDRMMTALRQMDPLFGQDFFTSPVATATGSAGAAIVINRCTGQFTAIDQTFPDDDEDENNNQIISSGNHNNNNSNNESQEEVDDDDESSEAIGSDGEENDGGEDQQQQRRRRRTTAKNNATSSSSVLLRAPVPGSAGDVTKIAVGNDQAQRQKILQSLVESSTNNNNKQNASSPTNSKAAQNNNNNQAAPSSSSLINNQRVALNPYNNIVGGLPLFPGEEVSAVTIGDSGAVAITTAITRPQLAQNYYDQQVALAAATANNNNNNNVVGASSADSPQNNNVSSSSTPQTPQASIGAQQQPAGSSSHANLPSLSTTTTNYQLQYNNFPTSLLSGTQNNNNNSSGTCGRLLIYSSVPPTTHQATSSGQGAPRRSGVSKLLAPQNSQNQNQQPDFAVFLPQSFICGEITISSDEEYFALSAASTGIFTVAAATYLKESSSSSSCSFYANNKKSPQVLVYRKIQLQDAFSSSVSPSGSSSSTAQQIEVTNTNNTTTANTNTASTNQQQQQQTSARFHQIPTNCDTTLVFLGSVSPPSHAMQSSSLLPTSVTPACHFLFRPIECRYAHNITSSFPMTCHTLLVAWRGYNCFTTLPLTNNNNNNNNNEFGTLEVMKGSAHDYAQFASAAIQNATVMTNMHINYQQQHKQTTNNTNIRQQNQTAGIFSVRIVAALPPLIPSGFNASNNNNKRSSTSSSSSLSLLSITENTFNNDLLINSSGTSNNGKSNINNRSQNENDVETSASSANPVNNFVNDILLGGGANNSNNNNNSLQLQHRSLPHIITTTTLCPRTSRIALGLAEGVVCVWSHGEPPCFTTITVAAPHRADATVNTTNSSSSSSNGSSSSRGRRPMITTTVSFFRDTHIVAGLSVPVQIKPVDDLPSVHYSRVVVAELNTGSITATVPHVPNLSLATTIGDNLPLILLFGGGGRTMWVANIYTGEIMAEVGGSGGNNHHNSNNSSASTLTQAVTPDVVNTFCTPSTVSGDHLIDFCSRLNRSFFSCPITGVLYCMCTSNSIGDKKNQNNNSNSSNNASSSTNIRRNNINNNNRGGRNIISNTNQQQNLVEEVLSATLLRVDGPSIVAALRPMLSKRDDIVRARRDVPEISYLLDSVLPGSPLSSMNSDNADGTMKHNKSRQTSAKFVKLSASAINNNATTDNNIATGSNAIMMSVMKSSIAGGGSVANMTHHTSNNNNMLSASQFGGGATNYTSGGGVLLSSSSMYHQPPSNELVQMPIAEISRKMNSGKQERAKRVNKLLDDLLVSASSGASIIGK